MTAGLLLEESSPNAVAFVLAWLLPLADSPQHLGMIRHEAAPLPYRQVNLIAEKDDPEAGISEATVSIHTMATATDGIDADTLALREGDRTHRRMMLLARTLDTDVQMADGRTANLDYLTTVEKPAWRDYGDSAIARVKAVYLLGFSYVAL